MHILDFLKNAREDSRASEDSVRVEYRLVCSGTLYPANIIGDWRKSDVARILLRQPAELLVASRPYDDYPQELVLRFVAPLVTKSQGISTHAYHPDQEIATDFAALLTLLCRRLITVSALVRQHYHESQVTPILADYPIPFVKTVKMSYWMPRPTDFIYGKDGVQMRSYDPHPQPFNPAQIAESLLALPQLAVAPAVIRAARLYTSAMERIETQPETCYQLFISAAETVACAVLENWEPDTEGKIASKGALVSYATKTEKLSKDVAERLALEACKGNPWSGKKFKKFLLANLDQEAIKSEDDLFIVPDYFRPSEHDIEKALDEVYRTRSGATHAGHAYPASAVIGPSHLIPSKALDAVINQQRPFPPIGWFERIVNSAICGCLRSQVRQPAPAPPESRKESADE